MTEIDRAQSERSRRGWKTRIDRAEAVGKESLLKGRLASRALGSAKGMALKHGDPALLVRGVTYNRAWDVHPADYDKLELPDYQRGIQPDEVNELLRVLRAGGLIPDPITLSNRKWKDAGKPGRYYIVDGQQRALAHIELNKVIRAIVYDCESLDAERQLFVVLNTTRTVSPNNIIAAASNKAAAFLREINATEGHPCCGRIVLKDGSGSGAMNIGASVVLRGMSLSLGVPPHARGRSAQKLMPLLEQAWDRETADAYVRTIAGITAEGDESRLRLLVAVGLGKVFAERKAEHGGKPVMPSRMSMAAMRRVNWGNFTLGTWSEKFLPIVVERIREMWKS